MKVHVLEAIDFIDETVIPKYVPQDYYLEQPIALGSSIVSYRKDNQVHSVYNTRGLFNPHRNFADEALCDSIRETYKCFEVIEVESPIARDNIPS